MPSPSRRRIASRTGVLPIQVALSWILRQPGVASPIVGVTKLEQLDQLVAALDYELSDTDAKYLEEQYQPHRVLGH